MYSCCSAPCLSSCPSLPCPCPLPCVRPSNPIFPPRTRSTCCGPCCCPSNCCVPPSCCSSSPSCGLPCRCNPCCGAGCNCCCPPRCGVFRPCCDRCYIGSRNCCTCAKQSTRQIPSKFIMPFGRPASLHPPGCKDRIRKMLRKPCISIFNHPCKDCPPHPVRIALKNVPEKWKETETRNFCCVPGVPSCTLRC